MAKSTQSGFQSLILLLNNRVVIAVLIIVKQCSVTLVSYHIHIIRVCFPLLGRVHLRHSMTPASVVFVKMAGENNASAS